MRMVRWANHGDGQACLVEADKGLRRGPVRIERNGEYANRHLV